MGKNVKTALQKVYVQNEAPNLYTGLLFCDTGKVPFFSFAALVLYFVYFKSTT